MKRKALAAIMAAAMALSMVGCGGSTSDSTDSTKTTDTPEATDSAESTDSTASADGTVENKTNLCAGSTVSHPAVLPANWTKKL